MSPFNDQQDLLSQLSESTAISAVVPSQPAQLTSDGGSSFIEVSMGTADSSGSTDRSASIISDRPPTKGPQPASFRVRPKGVPKRKSLTGLFDLAITKSFDRAKSASPLVPHFVNPLPVAFASAVEVEEQFEAHAHTEQTADSDFPALQGASRFISRLGEGNRRFERNMLQGYGEFSCDPERTLI
jgi:hypothetical protein